MTAPANAEGYGPFGGAGGIADPAREDDAAVIGRVNAGDDGAAAVAHQLDQSTSPSGSTLRCASSARSAAADAP
jgi:hypothetical protein